MATTPKQKILKRDRRKHSLCYDCGLVKCNTYYCEDCRQIRSLYYNQRRDHAKANGLCQKCCKREAIENEYYCRICKTRRHKSVVNRARKLYSEGICFRCGKKPTLESLLQKSIYSQFCEDCFFKKTASETMDSTKFAEFLKEKFYSQKQICPYSGDKLILGYNATVDHIVPVSDNPDLKDDPENIQWVTASVNQAKWTMSHEQFLDFIKRVSNNLFS